MCCIELTVLSFPTMDSFSVFGVVLPKTSAKKKKKKNSLPNVDGKSSLLFKRERCFKNYFLTITRLRCTSSIGTTPTRDEKWGVPHPHLLAEVVLFPHRGRQPWEPLAQEVTPLLRSHGLTCSQAALWLAGRTATPFLFIPEGGLSRNCLPSNAQGPPCCFSHHFKASSHHFHQSQASGVLMLLRNQLAA